MPKKFSKPLKKWQLEMNKDSVTDTKEQNDPDQESDDDEKEILLKK